MAKAMTIESVRIHCDECHHEFSGNVPDWHNKPCPKCGDGVLISDDDMAVYQGILSLAELFNAAAGDVEPGPTMTVEFDTAGLRKEQTP